MASCMAQCRHSTRNLQYLELDRPASQHRSGEHLESGKQAASQRVRLTLSHARARAHTSPLGATVTGQLGTAWQQSIVIHAAAQTTKLARSIRLLLGESLSAPGREEGAGARKCGHRQPSSRAREPLFQQSAGAM